jgi:fluoride exporter
MAFSQFERVISMAFLIVFLGSGIGGACRYGAGLWAMRFLSPANAMIGTFGINVVGSMVMAIVAESFAIRGGWPAEWRLFLATGILGGFTTFSSFTLEIATLYQRGQVGFAAAYLVGSVAVSLAAFFLGLALVRLVAHA